MNIILTTLNSKFIHSALSIRYLKSYSEDVAPIKIMEFTVNQSIDYIVGEIYKSDPDVIGFSIYIWNREESLKICETLKIIKPEIKIILGGPEVSFDGENILKQNWFIDFIIYGEGEATFRELIKIIRDGENDYSKINGIIYREEDTIIRHPPRPLIKKLDSIPSPYKGVGDSFNNKIVYFESSRGCPFNCRFCLSSTIKGVRYFSIERVKEDLDILIKAQVRQVKFVDRTFNANKKYAMEIMEFIMKKNPKNMNFHFEVTANLLDRDMLNFIKKAKEGLFQFEIGVQSTNPKTLEAVGRDTDFNKLKKVCKEIKTNNNIHQHLDLIAGLPYESYERFKQSFNDVYDIRPEKIQLGFLKLLKGSGLRKDKEKYNFKFLDKPPYEVLSTDYISYEEMLKLKGIEDLVEKYYNEGYFKNSIEYIVKNKYKTVFDFFEDFLVYWEENKYHTISHSRNKLYHILLRFYNRKNLTNQMVFHELLKYDYIFNNNPSVPNFFERIEAKSIQKNKHNILKDKELLNSYLIHYKNIATKEIIKKVHIEKFRIDIKGLINGKYLLNDNINKEVYILFDYRDGIIIRCETYDITKFISKE